MMNKEIPGKVILIDDQQEDIEALMSDFMSSGHGCIFVRNTDDIEVSVSGVRLIVLDLDIDDDGQVTEGDTKQLALLLSKLLDAGAAFFLIAIWSKHIEGDTKEAKQTIEDIKGEFKEITGRNLTGFFLPSMSKKLNHNEVLDEVEKWIETNPHAGLLFEWERLLERSRDLTLSEILDLEGKNLYYLVKVLTDSAIGSVDRELVRLLNRVLLRSMTLSNIKGITDLAKSIIEDSGGDDIDLDWYPRFHYLQTYYKLRPDDPIWTGDIIEFDNKESYKQLAVVVTPQCDLDQKKTDLIKVVYGIRVDNVDKNQEGAYAIAFPGKPYRNDDGDKTDSARHFLRRIAGAETGLSNHLYVLRYIYQDISFFHLLLDFRNTEAIRIEEIKNEMRQGNANRICRVDRPDVEDLLQNYAAMSSRVGVFDIPKPFMDRDADRLIGD